MHRHRYTCFDGDISTHTHNTNTRKLIYIHPHAAGTYTHSVKMDLSAPVHKHIKSPWAKLRAYSFPTSFYDLCFYFAALFYMRVYELHPHSPAIPGHCRDFAHSALALIRGMSSVMK